MHRAHCVCTKMHICSRKKGACSWVCVWECLSVCVWSSRCWCLRVFFMSYGHWICSYILHMHEHIHAQRTALSQTVISHSEIAFQRAWSSPFSSTIRQRTPGEEEREWERETLTHIAAYHENCCLIFHIEQFPLILRRTAKSFLYQITSSMRPTLYIPLNSAIFPLLISQWTGLTIWYLPNGRRNVGAKNEQWDHNSRNYTNKTYEPNNNKNKTYVSLLKHKSFNVPHQTIHYRMTSVRSSYVLGIRRTFVSKTDTLCDRHALRRYLLLELQPIHLAR